MLDMPSTYKNSLIKGTVAENSELYTRLNVNYYVETLLSDEHIIEGIYNIGTYGYSSLYQWRGRVALLIPEEYFEAGGVSSYLKKRLCLVVIKPSL